MLKHGREDTTRPFTGSLSTHQAKVEGLNGIPAFVSDRIRDKGRSRSGRQPVFVLHWQLLQLCVLAQMLY